MLALDNRKPTDAGADKDTSALGEVRSDFQTRLLHRKIRGSHGVMDEVVHLFEIFFVTPQQRIEVFHLSGNLGGKLRGIEPGDPVHTTAALTEGFPRLFGSGSQRGDQSHAGDYNTSFLQNYLTDFL